LSSKRKRIGVMTWHFGVTWRYRSRDHSILHRLFIIGGPLEPSLAISSRFWDIGLKHIGVTSLTFQGHVTSSVTWPFDSP